MLRIIAWLLVTILLGGCVAPQRMGISSSQWEKMSPEEQSVTVKNYKTIQKTSTSKTSTVYAGPKLSVYILRGKAMMPPFIKRYTLETTEFKIAPGDCKSILLRSVDTDRHTYLRACYNGVKLSIDPSRYQLNQREGSVHFDYNPIWKQGFTYSNINSKGYVSLQSASISIKAIPDGNDSIDPLRKP